MTIVTVIGARPQFIKCAPVSREIRVFAKEILIHTGQHYDDTMSDSFFRDLGLPRPDHNLGVGSGSHGAQTGAMLTGIERVLEKSKPDTVLVYGDTNSTLAGALAAVKLNLPVAHVEAGLRSFERRMPEEINRIVTDHVSTILFPPTKTAVKNLDDEGIRKGVHLVGDVMYDALRHNIKIARVESKVLNRLELKPGGYLLATIHRAGNTDDAEKLGGILTALSELGSAERPVLFPVHPRTGKMLSKTTVPAGAGLKFTNPASYLDMLHLEENAAAILTDSGGVQKEAFWLGVPCITLRQETEWVETVEAGANRIAGTGRDGIIRAVADALAAPRPKPGEDIGNGRAAAGIARILAEST